MRILLGAFIFGIIGLFTFIGVMTPGMGWFLYLFLIPFWAMFPIIILGVKGALVLLGIYVVGFPIAKLIVARSAWYEKAKKDLKSKGTTTIGGFTMSSGGSGGSSWSSSSSSVEQRRFLGRRRQLRRRRQLGELVAHPFALHASRRARLTRERSRSPSAQRCRGERQSHPSAHRESRGARERRRCPPARTTSAHRLVLLGDALAAAPMRRSGSAARSEARLRSIVVSERSAICDAVVELDGAHLDERRGEALQRARRDVTGRRSASPGATRCARMRSSAAARRGRVGDELERAARDERARRSGTAG